MTIQLSIIIPFLNSHELVRRQFLYWHRIGIPGPDTEILVMDDGSDPPIESVVSWPWSGAVRIIPTNDFRPWTSSLARNTAAKLAHGEYLFMTDGDYILTREAVDKARNFRGDRLGCKRRFGVIDENGEFKTDDKTLIEWGIQPSRIKAKGNRLPTHPNNFVMRATLFQEMGGYREDLILGRGYPQKEDTYFKRKLMKMVFAGQITLTNEDRPIIYMFPNGQYCGDVDANPFNMFHTLTRKTPENHWYTHQRYPKDPVCEPV